MWNHLSIVQWVFNSIPVDFELLGPNGQYNWTSVMNALQTADKKEDSSILSFLLTTVAKPLMKQILKCKDKVLFVFSFHFDFKNKKYNKKFGHNVFDYSRQWDKEDLISIFNENGFEE